MNLHHTHIGRADLSVSAPRDLSAIKPQSMPGAGLNCLQPPSDVPGRSHYSGLGTVSCLLAPFHRNVRTTSTVAFTMKWLSYI